MRASDQIKEHRSYVFRRKATGEIEVRGSHWVPGYTSDYCATPDEAIDQAIKKAEREMARLQTEIEELYDYKATMMSEDR